MSYLSTDQAYDYATLACWYQNSIDETVPPIWTDEHLEELLKDFYVIPKDTPTADVAPKSEVEMWFRECEELQGRLIELEKEVARGIFEELAREVYSKIPDKILPITIKGMSRELDYGDGLNFGKRDAYFDTLKIIAELKGKYTEGEG